VTAYLITDCGSTTTKAILVANDGGRGGSPAAAAPPGAARSLADEPPYRLVAHAAAPTTVESPVADITVGVLAAVAALEARCGKRLLRRVPGGGCAPDPAAATYLSTSSAGGGLQMAVFGLTGRFSGASAERAALAAGAVVAGRFSLDDGLEPHQRIAALRRLRPDIVLLAGGTDGGARAQLIQLAEWVAASGAPAVVYAGNRSARPDVARVLGRRVALRAAANVRPALGQEELAAARHVIHELFLEQVMARAPGSRGLLRWVAAPVLPTPAAVGLLVQAAAARFGADVVAVDIGGATTDVLSVRRGRFRRSVSANLGMSYSAVHVCEAAGTASVARWLPWFLPPAELLDRVANKMARPTTVPATVEDLCLEQALAREAMRLALAHHLEGRPLDGRPRPGLLVGSGGVLCHAPRRAQAALMLIDALQPVGVWRLAVDAVFLMPHLGILSTVNRRAAEEVFWGDGLVPLGTVVAPASPVLRRPPPGLRGLLAAPGGARRLSVAGGDLAAWPLGPGARARLELEPLDGGDLGAGPGRPLTVEVEGGEVGLVLDCRGRPIPFPPEPAAACATVARWLQAVGALPGVGGA
jgi:hypothetical protein